jgi:hypothetical protein
MTVGECPALTGLFTYFESASLIARMLSQPDSPSLAEQPSRALRYRGYLVTGDFNGIPNRGTRIQHANGISKTITALDHPGFNQQLAVTIVMKAIGCNLRRNGG